MPRRLDDLEVPSASTCALRQPPPPGQEGGRQVRVVPGGYPGTELPPRAVRGLFVWPGPSLISVGSWGTVASVGLGGTCPVSACGMGGRRGAFFCRGIVGSNAECTFLGWGGIWELSVFD